MSDYSEVRLLHILAKVEAEYQAAIAKFPVPFRSSHEGYAVILEEMDELWEDIKAGRYQQAQLEAKQVAAMAVRFMMDCDKDGVWFGAEDRLKAVKEDAE
jgi:hypothetical protein